MDLIKIGKFISYLRKEKGLTQEDLALKLYVTDRAVSKWERGISFIDAGKMIDLCDILGISVNELLMGERIDMKDYEKKTEELLVELAKQEEENNKRSFRHMWVLLITTFIFYLGIVLISYYTLGEGKTLGTIIFVSTLVLVSVCFYALKIEADSGYYECRKCSHRFKPSYFKVLIAPHINLIRLLRCPKCHKIAFDKKVMSKENE